MCVCVCVHMQFIRKEKPSSLIRPSSLHSPDSALIYICFIEVKRWVRLSRCLPAHSLCSAEKRQHPWIPAALPAGDLPFCPVEIFPWWRPQGWKIGEWRREFVLEFMNCVCEKLKRHGSPINITDMSKIIILFIILQSIKPMPFNGVGIMKGNIKLIGQAQCKVSVVTSMHCFNSLSSYFKWLLLRELPNIFLANVSSFFPFFPF